MSQLLARIEQELQFPLGTIQRAELLARKASYLARVGRFDETREIIAAVRSEFGDGRSGHVSAWIMLTEGVLHLFENLSPQALDRINRSQLLGLAMKDAAMVAISSAWKAHIEFETSKFDSMVQSLRLALSHATPDDHDAHARIAMTISDSFLLCGDRSNAQRWFMTSRDHALKDGDQASIEALLYNRAAFGLARLRAQRCFSDIGEDVISLVRLEIASAKNLQTLTGVAALTNFVHLCQARLLLLSNEFFPAIDALEAVRYQKPFAEYNFDQRFIDLEIAYCLAKLGRTIEAQSLANSLESAKFDGLDVDEQLVAAWIWHELAVSGVEYATRATAKSRLDSLAMKYQQECESLAVKLEPFRSAQS